jgi:hypothetical protein
MNIHAIGRSSCITHHYEQEFSVFCHLVWIFLKMLKQSTLSVDDELFITEIEQLLVIWDPTSSSYSKKQEKTHAWLALCNKYIENYFFFL